VPKSDVWLEKQCFLRQSFPNIRQEEQDALLPGIHLSSEYYIQHFLRFGVPQQVTLVGLKICGQRAASLATVLEESTGDKVVQGD
jgi:hypothetical protein